MAKILITTNHPAPYMDRWFCALENEYELTVVYNHMKNSRKAWKNFNGYEGYCFEQLNTHEISKLIKAQNLLVVGGWTNKECLCTIILGKLFRKKVAVFTDYPFHQNRYADIFKNLFLYRIIDYVYCATKSTCDLIERKYNLPSQKVVYFPYAVDFGNVPNEVQKDNPKGKIKVLIANNFMERKGYSALFEALKMLDNEGTTDFEFNIAGHGELFEKYKKMAETMKLDIKFYGWIEESEYRKLQEECQVYIHASLEEPFGIPPLDAMSREKIVIVSDGVKSTDMLMRNGWNGFIYPAHESKKLYEILTGLKNYDFHAVGQNARKTVIENFSIENNIMAIRKSLNDGRE